MITLGSRRWALESAGRLWQQLDRQVVGMIVLAKLSVLLTIFIAYHTFPFLSWTYYAALHYPAYEGISLHTAFKTWDAEHYIYLSEVGYHRLGPSNAYYPLLPGLMHLVTFVTHNAQISGLIIANAASLVALYYLYLFALRRGLARRAALLCLLLLLTFPTAFYLSLIYTESLFLLLSLCFFYYLYEDNYVLCSVFAFLLPLTRPLGILIVVPWLIYHYAMKRPALSTSPPYRARAGARRRARTATSRRPAGLRPIPLLSRADKLPQNAAFIAAPLVGYLDYLCFIYLATGDPFSAFHLESTSMGAWHISNIVRPDLLISNFFQPLQLPDLTLGFSSPTDSPLDRGFFLLFLLGLPLVYIETDWALFSCYLLLGSVPMLGSFMSYSRYLMPAFPLYLGVARWVVDRRLKAVPVSWMLIGYAASLILLARHALSYWVA